MLEEVGCRKECGKWGRCENPMKSFRLLIYIPKHLQYGGLYNGLRTPKCKTPFLPV